jgi:hypothetical protein
MRRTTFGGRAVGAAAKLSEAMVFLKESSVHLDLYRISILKHHPTGSTPAICSFKVPYPTLTSKDRRPIRRTASISTTYPNIFTVPDKQFGVKL